MSNVIDHLGIPNVSKRLAVHNIGLFKVIQGLLFQYNRKVTFFQPNLTKKWQADQTAATTLIDSAIDTKNGLVFVITNAYLQCLDIKKGEEIWKVTMSPTLASMVAWVACSPKHRFVYVTDGSSAKIKRYDYSGNFLNEENTAFQAYKPGIFDEHDVIMLFIKSGTANSYKRRKLNMDLSPIATHTSSNEGDSEQPIISRNKDRRAYWLFGSKFAYVDVLGNISTAVSVGPSMSISSSSWSQKFPLTIEGQYGYFLRTYDVGNPFTQYQIFKADLVNNVVIWIKNFESTASGYTGNKPTVTHDDDYVYAAIEPENATDGIATVIYCINKETGDVTTVAFEPNVITNDDNIKLYSTKDVQNNQRRFFPGVLIGDFTGKTAVGDTTGNPHIMRGGSAATLQNPTVHPEIYNSYIRVEDGSEINTSVAAQATPLIPQHVFSFNIIEMYKRLTGYTFTPDEIKGGIDTTSIHWAGFGKGNNVGGARTGVWDPGLGVWDTSTPGNTATADSEAVAFDISTDKIGSDGFIHITAYCPNPTNSTYPSTIYSDYVSITVENKQDYFLELTM